MNIDQSATIVQQLTRYFGALFSSNRRTMSASLYSMHVCAGVWTELNMLKDTLCCYY